MSTIDEIMGAIGRHGDDCIRDADAASESFDGLRELIAAALAAPDGWRLVPADPTMAMMQAALTASRANGPVSGSMEFSLPVCHELSASELVYRAMIATAPEHKA